MGILDNVHSSAHAGNSFRPEINSFLWKEKVSVTVRNRQLYAVKFAQSILKISLSFALRSWKSTDFFII